MCQAEYILLGAVEINYSMKETSAKHVIFWLRQIISVILKWGELFKTNFMVHTVCCGL